MAAGDLCTLQQVREHRQFPDTEAEQDLVISDLITRWSQFIMAQKGREFAPTTSATARTLQFKPNGSTSLIVDLRPWDLRSATAVAVDGSSLGTTEYDLTWHDRLTSTYLGLEVHYITAVAPRRRRTLTVTGDWGCASIPEPARQACILAVIMTLVGEVQAFGGALQPNSFGEGVNEPVALPPGVRGLLSPYTR